MSTFGNNTYGLILTCLLWYMKMQLNYYIHLKMQMLFIPLSSIFVLLAFFRLFLEAQSDMPDCWLSNYTYTRVIREVQIKTFLRLKWSILAPYKHLTPAERILVIAAAYYDIPKVCFAKAVKWFSRFIYRNEELFLLGHQLLYDFGLRTGAEVGFYKGTVRTIHEHIQGPLITPNHPFLNARMRKLEPQ